MAAESTPLLSQPNTNPPKLTKLADDDHNNNSLDSIIENIIGDDFSWPIFLQAALASFAWFFDGQQTFINVFADAEPPWHCRRTGGSSQCLRVSDVCALPAASWAWDLPPGASTLSEWGLQCGGSLPAGAPASAFFAGSLLGGIVLTTLADSILGRRKMLLLSCLATAVSALLTAFSADVWAYTALRFLTGFGRAAIATSSLVLATELVGKSWRGMVGVVGFVFFTLGFLSLPAIAYSNKGHSWRNLYIFTSVPNFFYCLLLHFFVRESPRWLFVRGRKEEAIETLKTLSRHRHQKNEQSLNHLVFSTLSLDDDDHIQQEAARSSGIFSAVEMLVAKKWAIRRLSAAMALGFGIGMVYFGMPLALGNLSFNLYLSVALNALCEIPSSALTYFLVARMNRRTSILLSTISCGIFSLMSVLDLGRYQILPELVSFFGASASSNLVLIFAVELFPTSVRNSAVSMVRQAMVLGGVIAPLLAADGRGDRRFVSYGVFGIVIVLSGLFVVCLPETRGTVLCDTMDEEEHKDETAKICCESSDGCLA